MINKQSSQRDEYFVLNENLQSAEEYKEPSDNIGFTGEEFWGTGEEYSGSKEEFYVCSDQRSDGSHRKLSDNKKQKKILHKMGYLVVASVAAVSILQAANQTPQDGTSWSENTESLGNGDLQDTNIVESEIADSGESTGIPVQELQGILTSVDTFVLPSANGNLYGAYNGKIYRVNGETIESSVDIECVNGFYDNGYLLVQEKTTLKQYVLDTNGNIVFDYQALGEEWKESSEHKDSIEGVDVYISIHDGVACEIFSEYAYGVYQDNFLRLINLKDGSIITELPLEDWFYVSDFNEGVVLCTQEYTPDYKEVIRLSILHADGRVQVIEDSETRTSDLQPINEYLIPFDAPSEGYFLTVHNNDNGIYSLIDLSSGSRAVTFRVDLLYEQLKLEYGTFFRHGHYGFLSGQTGNGAYKCVLVDLLDIDENGKLTNCIAEYDKIYLRDSRYLLVREEDAYLYIDWNGNVVSDSYYDATPFSSEGFAMVMEEQDKVCIVNEQFETVETIYYAIIGNPDTYDTLRYYGNGEKTLAKGEDGFQIILLYGFSDYVDLNGYRVSEDRISSDYTYTYYYGTKYR